MTRGFVTIATGGIHYYQIAANMLMSYQYYAKSPLPVAIICDRENEYTQLFDRTIILDNATKSWMDKLFLLDYIPWDETIFIESDFLAYSDLNILFECFKDADDFSVFGQNLPLDTDATYGLDREDGKEWGWFDPQKVGKYKDRILALPKFGSGIIFMRKGKKCEEAASILHDVWENAKNYGLIPIDDDILALTLAASQCSCIPFKNGYQMVYWQMYENRRKGWKLYPNQHKGSCWFVDPEWGRFNANYCHWGTRFTKIALYKREVGIVKYRVKKKPIREWICYLGYTIAIPFSNIHYEVSRLIPRYIRKIKKWAYPLVKKIRK